MITVAPRDKRQCLQVPPRTRIFVAVNFRQPRAVPLRRPRPETVGVAAAVVVESYVFVFAIAVIVRDCFID